MLLEHRGKGIAGEIKKHFFDELRKQGIEEVAATVEIDNKRSNNAQDKLINNYGGRSYRVNGKHHDKEETTFYNRYIVNTDTSGKSKALYKENKPNEITEKIATLRNRLKTSDTKVPYKSTQDLSRVDFNILEYIQNKKQNA